MQIGKRKLLAKTCLVCGCFKQAREYAKVMKFYHTSYCNLCKNNMARPKLYKHQEKALDGALKHRQRWSDGELALLAQMTAEGHTGPQMATALNRSLYSVYTMKHTLSKES